VVQLRTEGGKIEPGRIAFDSANYVDGGRLLEPIQSAPERYDCRRNALGSLATIRAMPQKRRHIRQFSANARCSQWKSERDIREMTQLSHPAL